MTPAIEPLEERLGATAQRLMIPTNPSVEVATLEPREFEYANPVTLNNLLLLYGNARIELGDKLERANKRLEGAKLEKRKAERQLEDFETARLRTSPAPRGVSTLKLLAAHIESAAFLEGLSDQYDELREALAEAEDAVHAAQAGVNRLKDWGDTLEAATNSITVHLSYVKAEWQHAGRR